MGNIPYTEIILPYKNRRIEFSIYKRRDTTDFHGNFSIGFVLILQRGGVFDDFLVTDTISGKKEKKKIIKKAEKDTRKRTHLIWSNSLTF